MKRFQDLSINCSTEEATRIVDGIKARIGMASDQWEINEKAMKDTAGETGVFAPSGPFLYANNLEKRAMVALLYRTASPKGGAGLFVANIVPLETPNLTPEQYNAVLDLFRKELVDPALNGLQMRAPVEQTSEDWSALDVMPKNCADLLDQFAGLANKHSLHPNDEARWRKFVQAAWKSERPVDEWNVSRILEEQYGFPADLATTLEEQLIFGITLLKQAYDR